MVTYHEADLATLCSTLAMSIFTITEKTGNYKLKTYQVYILVVQKVALYIRALDRERFKTEDSRVEHKSESRIQTHAHC